MIPVTCPTCSQTDQHPDDLAGQSTRCSHCGRELQVPATAAPGKLTERVKQAAGGAKSLAVGAAGSVGSAAKQAGARAATAIGGLTTRVGAAVGEHAGILIQRVRGNRPPLVSAAVLYKVGLGAAWAAGVPDGAEVQQINEWLDAQPAEIAACLQELHPPDQPMEVVTLFRYTKPPQQLEGKVLLLRFVRQFFARSAKSSQACRQFVSELERWTDLEPEQLRSIREQLEAEEELERELEQREPSTWNLAGLWRATSSYAVAGGTHILGQTARFSHYLGDKAVAGWRSWGDVPKPIKVALVTAAAGGTVVTSPFLLAALSSVSIVSILATLGLGPLAAGGFGVAGGVAVLILSCASASTLSAFLGAKLIKDPEVEKLIAALRDLHALVEKSKQVSVSQIEKMRQYDAEVKRLILQRNMLSTDVILLRGKIEAMREELQTQMVEA
jgi:hypothetical protein